MGLLGSAPHFAKVRRQLKWPVFTLGVKASAVLRTALSSPLGVFSIIARRRMKFAAMLRRNTYTLTA